MQSKKHPHIIYQSDERPRQLCGVLDKMNGVRNSNYNRQKRDYSQFDWGNRTKRDVRYVPKFIETALVLDKAMVSSVFQMPKPFNSISALENDCKNIFMSQVHSRGRGVQSEPVQSTRFSQIFLKKAKKILKSI